MRRAKLLLRTVVLTSFFCACSAQQIVKREYTETGLPEDLVKAFAVKEIAAPLDASKLGPTESGAQAEKKPKKKKRKTKGLMGDTKSTFVIPNRRPPKDPVWVGEKIFMDVTWLNTTAGEFLLEVNPYKELNGRKVYDIKGSAKTSSLFSLIYKAEDWVQTFIDFEGWFPYKFILHGDETRYVRSNLELFDHAAKKQFVSVYAKRLDKDQIKDEKGYKDLVPFSQDSLSALYFARTHKMDPGTEIRFPMST
ncbi:MAG TPA: DUF3108 domain-containing protein, partial [Oligoflexia bacterium]|nr:DUF3108 domain-containing protein [Oligoflexia bacterium]